MWGIRMTDRNRYHSDANLLDFWAWNLKRRTCSVRSLGSKMLWISNCVIWIVLCICEVRTMTLPVGIEKTNFCKNTAYSLIARATFSYEQSWFSAFLVKEGGSKLLDYERECRGLGIASSMKSPAHLHTWLYADRARVPKDVAHIVLAPHTEWPASSPQLCTHHPDSYCNLCHLSPTSPRLSERI